MNLNILLLVLCPDNKHYGSRNVNVDDENDKNQMCGLIFI